MGRLGAVYDIFRAGLTLLLVDATSCPTCGNMLIVDKSEADGQHRFSCMTCPYDYPIAGKQVRPGCLTQRFEVIFDDGRCRTKYVETNYLQRKQADDVLGGEDSWKNVDSIEGKAA